MTRRISVFQIFFLFLAASVFNAHMLIPHDHHIADSDGCHENSYPINNTTSTHHPLFPVHCHAFNDLTSEKAIPGIVIAYIPITDFLPGSELYTEPDRNQLSQLPGAEGSNLSLSPGILLIQSLRAPPTA